MILDVLIYIESCGYQDKVIYFQLWTNKNNGMSAFACTYKKRE